MNVSFLGQGYNLGANTSVAQTLIECFANKDFHTFKCMVAFASQNGVSGLTEHINNSRTHIQTARVVIGIDQGATSMEALEKLLEWNAEIFIFYSAQPNIFHPKIYIFEGNNSVSIIVGSNNLTEMGLVKNIESSVLINFNKEEIEGHNLLDEINHYFGTILIGENLNLQELSTELIAQLVEEGIVPKEIERRDKIIKKDLPQKDVDQELQFATIKDLFPKIGIQSLPQSFKPQKRKILLNDSSIVNDTITPELPPISEYKVENNTDLLATASPVKNIWNYTDTNTVLIAEIGGPGRWSQISFAKANFETFFMLPTNVGGRGQINLKYLKTNGNLQNDVEVTTSSKVKASRNYNLEPAVVRASTVPYNSVNRPIIFFIKLDATHFIYHFETTGTPLYNQLNTILGVKNGSFLRRQIITVGDLRTSCPAITI